MKRLGQLLAIMLLVGCGPIAGGDDARLSQIGETYQQGDYTTAVSQLTEYVEDNPDNEQAWTLLGESYAKLMQPAKAQAAYESALKANPRYLFALTGLGNVYSQQGKLEEAMKTYEQAIEVDPSDAHTYTGMAVVALQMGDNEKALPLAIKGYELAPTEPVMAENLALAYHYNGDIPNRDKYAKIVAELDGVESEYLEAIFSGKLSLREN